MSIRFQTILKKGSILFLGLFFLTSCSEPIERDTLTIANAKQPSNALTFIALEKGFFSAEGLDITFELFPSGKRALQDGFLNPEKDFDLVISTEMPFSAALFEGHSIVTFGHIFSADNVNRIVANKQKGIDQPADLKGHTIATQEESAVHYFLQQVLDVNRIQPEDVTLKFMKAEKLPNALANGDIDAFSMREPIVSQTIELMGEHNLTIMQAYGLYRQYELLISTPAKIEAKPQAFHKLLKALLKSQLFAIEHPQETIAIVARYLDMPVQELEKTWAPNALKLGLQQGLLITLEKQERWLTRIHQQKQLPNLSPIKTYTDYFYFPPLEVIAPELIAVIRTHENQQTQ